IATAMAEAPDSPRRWQTGAAPHVPLARPAHPRSKAMVSLARMALVKRRMRALRTIGRATYAIPLFTLIVDQWRTRRILQRYHARGYGNVNGNSAGAPAGAVKIALDRAT
ncbi:hypothetical protein J4732_21185, partial [Serratia marcescens]|nr:hypothetical protein [Serratia marcescens]